MASGSSTANLPPPISAAEVEKASGGTGCRMGSAERNPSSRHSGLPRSGKSGIEIHRPWLRVLKDVTQCDKLNVPAIGNVVPQLHLHIVARRKEDPLWPKPVWGAAPPRAGDKGGIRALYWSDPKQARTCGCWLSSCAKRQLRRAIRLPLQRIERPNTSVTAPGEQAITFCPRVLSRPQSGL